MNLHDKVISQITFFKNDGTKFKAEVSIDRFEDIDSDDKLIIKIKDTKGLYKQKIDEKS